MTPPVPGFGFEDVPVEGGLSSIVQTSDTRGAAQTASRARLLEAGLLIDTGVDGLYGRSAVFEDLVEAVDRLIIRAGTDQRSVRLHFPPVMPRAVFERTDYLVSFPNLTGSVHAFESGDSEHALLLASHQAGDSWSDWLSPTDVVLQPAACHPLYPLNTGRLPQGGRRYEVYGYCFRHEPSIDPARMQCFRMHEYVYLGTPQLALEHRDTWIDRATAVLLDLEIPVSVVVASDPFFGRVGRILASGQRDAALKLELVTPVCGDDGGVAVVSSNYHRDHFGLNFGIENSDGETAHSACVGFGMERIVLAMLHFHGLDPATWSSSLRSRLWP